MRLSQSDLIFKRKDQKLRKKVKGKKKHKRLDAICELAYKRSREGVEKVESSKLNDGEDEMDLRRSGRTRRAPVLLDSSPPPPKKRRKVDRSQIHSVEKVNGNDGVNSEMGCSDSKELDGQDGGWGSRLRSREQNISVYVRKRRESSLKGKRKLFQEFDGFTDGIEFRSSNKKVGLLSEKSTVVNSKRPGRVNGSSVLGNENQEIDLVCGLEDDKIKNRDNVVEVVDEGNLFSSEVKYDSSNELEEQEGCMASNSGEIENAVPSKLQNEECETNGNVETREENISLEKLAGGLELDQTVAVEIEADCAADKAKNGLLNKPLEDETCLKADKKFSALNLADHKPRIKLGRRCGLCGGGTDGKPPKVRLLDGDGSDNEAYSGSSACDEPNYDVWDGFGEDAGWLGRLLGPINDRFGIAGIWVHQQCAVWSPEVYFAGLGCLKNVRAALYRGRVLKCSRCRRPGATIGCRVDRCPKTYHLPCARAKGCIFDHRRFLIACTAHRRIFQPHGVQNTLRLKKLKSKKMKLELRKMSNDAYRKDIEAEEKWLENCGEDEEFLKRESKRLHRDLGRIAPVYIGGANGEDRTNYQGWESVAGLQNVIKCMKEVVILPLLYPEFFDNLGLTPPRGVLLHGYPGTGKTLVVRALVGSCARGEKRIAYFARKGADCLGKYVGDAERQLRLLFQVAEKSQPSIIFFDEIDGLAPCRTKQQDQTHSSVVSTLLALMDGLKSRGSVIVIGATNRPDAVDPALRRPGRFDREIYFPLPSVKDREAILSLHTQKWPKPISGSLLKWVAKQTIGFAGADLQALCTQAAIIALRKSFPMQEVLLAAETKDSHSKCPSIPTVFVEERDWLQALSCAPPPCSRRECGTAVNDVVASPLDTSLVPCLLQPLTGLLICLCLDESIWLPPPLTKACTSVKNVIVSDLNRRRLESVKWWSGVDNLLQEVNVVNEIEKNLLLENVLIGQSNLPICDVIEEYYDEFSSIISSNSLIMGARSSLLKDMPNTLHNKKGYQMLISGNAKSGQRHLASCLLHCFVGTVDVWKVDLASISHEGHGDMILGLTRILMRCTQAKFCMIYMPRIDLWAIETYHEASEDNESSPMNLQPTGSISCNGTPETDVEHRFCPSAVVEVKKASYIWTSFVEQVEWIRANTSLIILATSELPFSEFPHRVRQFFGSEIVNYSQSSPPDHKVPQFCVELDGKFDHDKVMNSLAVKLSKDFAQQYVQSNYSRIHICEKSSENAYDKLNGEISSDNSNGNVSRVCNSKSSPVCPLNPVSVLNKTVRGKSSLLLAISTIGYQILCYPHFAELCWVTSKLKAGPFANVNGPWKGWPFNSCIVRPMNSTEKVVAGPGSSDINSKECSVVRGLVAIGLSAYRGEYISPREICSEVRNVLETLVRRIDDKIQAGKDRTHFLRLLSQVAYLDDMVASWTHSLRSFEADTPKIEAQNRVCKESICEDDANKLEGCDVLMQKTETLESLGKTDASNGGDLANDANIFRDEGDESEVPIEEPLQPVVPDHSSPVKHCSAPNQVILVSSSKEIAGDDVFDRNDGSAKPRNGARESSDFQVDSRGPVDEPGDEHLSSTETSEQQNGSSTINNDLLATRTDMNVDNVSKLTDPTGNSAVTCIYQCCSECTKNLHNLLLRIINSRCSLIGVDSTVEDIYDFMSSLSVNLNFSLFKSSQAGSLSGKNHFERRKCQDMKNSEKGLMVECGCHTDTECLVKNDNFARKSRGLECSFIFKDGVLGTLDTDIVVPYHCKFEKLCLCSLIEQLEMDKGPYG